MPSATTRSPRDCLVSRSWQVLIVLYIISALLAAIAGFSMSGLTNTASVTLVNPQLLPSVAAAVIGGTSIFGGRGGYPGAIVGALILTVLPCAVVLIGLPEAVAPDPVRLDHRPRRGRLHARRRGVVAAWPARAADAASGARPWRHEHQVGGASNTRHASGGRSTTRRSPTPEGGPERGHRATRRGGARGM